METWIYRWLEDDQGEVTETYLADEAAVNAAVLWIGQNYGLNVIEAEIMPTEMVCINVKIYQEQYTDVVDMVQAFKTQFGDALVQDYKIHMRQ